MDVLFFVVVVLRPFADDISCPGDTLSKHSNGQLKIVCCLNFEAKDGQRLKNVYQLFKYKFQILLNDLLSSVCVCVFIIFFLLLIRAIKSNAHVEFVHNAHLAFVLSKTITILNFAYNI